MKTICVIGMLLLGWAGESSGAELSVSGTRFLLSGRPFPYTGVSFFNAIYNTSFNASTEARLAWLKKFQSYGIDVLRVWCQWDSKRGFVDASPTSTMYQPDGSLRPEHLSTLKSILRDADSPGVCVELVLFSQESWGEKISYEHDDARVLPLLKLIKSLDAKRLVTSCPGFSGVLGNDEENRAFDYLTPHTTRQGTGRHWEVAPRELESLLKKFHKPVVDDEPARNGTAQFGGPKAATSPFDHILQIHAVWQLGAYTTYHHDMFQTGYGTPAVPPGGVPDPDFSRITGKCLSF